MRFCLPIQARSTREVEEILTNWQQSYAVVEIWLDLLEDISISWVEALVKRLGRERAIFLFRRPNLEHPRMRVAERASMLEALTRLGAIVDLDVRAQPDEIGLWLQLKSSQSSVGDSLVPSLLASFHDYTSTPSLDELRSIYEEMGRIGANAVKFSTLCRTPQDAVTLLAWGLELQDKKVPMTVLGMGPYGQATRIFGSLWFNDLLFAPPVAAQASAPGQLLLSEYKSIFAILGGR